MAAQIALLLIGLALIVFGADWLVDGASAIARKLGISEFVIGLTIVGFGTSCPELVVSLTGAFAGNSDISIGNVFGSNIFNTLLILGITALLMPIAISSQNKRRDIPITIAVTLMLLLMGMSTTLFGLGNYDGISRIEGIVFLAVFALYLFYCFKSDITEEAGEAKNISMFKAVLLCLAGLAGLILGGRWFVSSATYLAHAMGVSDKFIAITILAGGTSLPELATCVVAAAKKKGQLALGNILGSNVFNILLILGCSAIVHPLSFEAINFVDMGTLLLSSLLVLFCAFTGRNNKVDRFDAILMLLCYVAYITWLFKTL